MILIIEPIYNDPQESEDIIDDIEDFCNKCGGVNFKHEYYNSNDEHDYYRCFNCRLQFNVDSFHRSLSNKPLNKLSGFSKGYNQALSHAIAITKMDIDNIDFEIKLKSTK